MNKVNRVIFALSNMGPGGAERVVSILANGFVKKNIKVDIWLYYGSTLHYKLDDRVNVSLFNIKKNSIVSRLIYIRRQLKKAKTDSANVVFIPFLSAILNVSIAANMGLGIPLIACERNNPCIKGNTFLKKIRSVLPFFFASYCVFQTPDARSYYSIVSTERCSVIPNPIPHSDYVWNGMCDEMHLISVCRLHKQKNLVMTLDVIESLKDSYPNVHLDVYGEGDLKLEIQNEINKRNLLNNISLCGTTQNVLQKLASSSVFISTSDYEGISNSMLEAMSVGVPMVCTDCPIGGAKMMLSDGGGILSPVRDVDGFVENVKKILNDYDLAQNISKKAQQKADQYSENSIVNMWLKVLSNLF